MISKKTVSILAALLVAAVIAVPAPAAQARASKPVLQGTYLETIHVPSENRTTVALITYTSDGTIITSGISRQGVRLAAHGTWDKVGNRRFAVTTWLLSSNLPETPECTFIVREVRSTITLNDAADSYTGTAQVRVFNCQGNLVGQFDDVAIEGRRLDVQPINE